jgi:hypothetical protein
MIINVLTIFSLMVSGAVAGHKPLALRR